MVRPDNAEDVVVRITQSVSLCENIHIDSNLLDMGLSKIGFKRIVDRVAIEFMVTSMDLMKIDLPSIDDCAGPFGCTTPRDILHIFFPAASLS